MKSDLKKNKYTIKSVRDYTNPWFAVDKDTIKYPNGTIHDYYILRRGNFFVSIIASDENKIILLKQWRPSLLRWIYEVPMGAIDNGETPLEAAKREFWEETGYQAKNWEQLGEFLVAPGHSDQSGIVFAARGLEKHTIKPQDKPDEMIEVNVLPMDELEAMIKSGSFNDGPSLASIMMFKTHYPNQGYI